MDGETIDPVGDADNGTEYPVIDLSNGDGQPEGDGIPTVDPATISFEADPSESGGGTGTKRRGRKPGSKNLPKSEVKEVSNDLTSLLFSCHFMLAKLTKVDELELTEDEAEKLGTALARVQKEFGVAVLSPKQRAVINLLMVGGGIYGSRAMAIINNAKQKKKEKKTGVIEMPVTTGVM